MNRGHVLQSTPVQQMMGGGNPNWWSINTNMRPPPPNPSLLPPPPPPSTLFPNHYAPLPDSSSWQDNNENHQQLPADSWSQLLLGGLVGDQEEQMLQLHHASSNNGTTTTTSELVKQENSSSSGGTTSFAYGTTSNWSQMMAAAASSPKSSCISSTISTNILDFSTNKSDASRHPPPDHSSECNSTANGGTPKKPRVQASSTQSTFKVRKEKLGDRITALHQLVSPFGKTDTASVLLEAIGYIRFLQSQIEALSLPYLGSGSANMRHQHSAVQGERNCLFPEDPGQLLNDNCMKRKGAPDQQDSNEEGKKDLRSRGLCLVPLSCTLQVGSDNGADYWAPALGGGGFR
ncbi:hypothetical protein LguiA_019995 [Lonicera macranthoides]